MDNYLKAKSLLEKYNQETVLNELEKNKNKLLINQILSIDFEEIEKLKNSISTPVEFNNDTIENIEYTDPSFLSTDDLKQCTTLGIDCISKGKYAVVTMAGGQRNKAWS